MSIHNNTLIKIPVYQSSTRVHTPLLLSHLSHSASLSSLSAAEAAPPPDLPDSNGKAVHKNGNTKPKPQTELLICVCL